MAPSDADEYHPLGQLAHRGQPICERCILASDDSAVVDEFDGKGVVEAEAEI